jgi:hypothetical protein
LLGNIDKRDGHHCEIGTTSGGVPRSHGFEFYSEQQKEALLQLLYVFGPKMSSVMFFPLNQILAINHSSNRMPPGKEPNARVDIFLEGLLMNSIICNGQQLP